MNLAFKRIKVYLKLVVMVAVATLCVVLVVANRKNTVTIWFFKEFTDINVLWLMAATASSAILIWRIVNLAGGVFRDMKELRQHDELRVEKEKQAELARKLAQHEQKLRHVEDPPAEQR